MWKYVKALQSPDLVENFLKKYQIELPDDLRKIITEYNGGRPLNKDFKTCDGIEHVFKSLLSYNEDDKETIYTVYPSLFEGCKLFPIGSDSSGNFICYDTEYGGYFLLDHELDQPMKIQDIDIVIKSQ